MNSFYHDFFSMSKLSATAMPFVPIHQLLIQFNSVVTQIQNKLKSVDMHFSSALQNFQTDMCDSSVQFKQIPIHTPLSSAKNDRNFKRYLRSKAWRDRHRVIVHDLPASRTSRHSRSNFIKYLQDYKKGKFQSANDIIIPNSKEGGVINSISTVTQSAVPSSIILNSVSTIPFHNNSDPMDISVKSGVMITSTAPRVFICLIAHPYLDFLRFQLLLHLFTYLTRFQFMLGPLIIFNLFTSSSFTEKCCVIPKPQFFPIYVILEKIRAKVASLLLSEYFYYSLFKLLYYFLLQSSEMLSPM